MALPTTRDPNRKKAMQDAQARMKLRRAADASQSAPIRDEALTAAGRENEEKPKKKT